MDADNDYPTSREFRKGYAGLMLYFSSLPGEVLVQDWEWTCQGGFHNVLREYAFLAWGLDDTGFAVLV